MSRCRYYVNDASCFKCPLPDCTWSPKDYKTVDHGEVGEYFRTRLAEEELRISTSEDKYDKKRAMDRARYWRGKLADFEAANMERIAK